MAYRSSCTCCPNATHHQTNGKNHLGLTRCLSRSSCPNATHHQTNGRNRLGQTCLESRNSCPNATHHQTNGRNHFGLTGLPKSWSDLCCHRTTIRNGLCRPKTRQTEPGLRNHSTVSCFRNRQNGACRPCSVVPLHFRVPLVSSILGAAGNRLRLALVFLISVGASPNAAEMTRAIPSGEAGNGPNLVMFGGDLLSRGPAAQVPSALAGLTSVFGMGTGGTLPPWPPKLFECRRTFIYVHLDHSIASTIISVFQIKALDLLVPVSSTHCCASTSGLSTWCSHQGSYPVIPVGDLILEPASRLDAFSAYPFRT